MRKIFKKFMALAITSFLVVGCGTSNQVNTDTDVKTTGGDDKLIVYSNSVSNGRGEYIKEYMKNNGVDVEFVDLGGNALTNRILAEKDSPVADVVFGLNQMVFNQIENTAPGIWKEYKPEWIDKIDPNNIQEGGKYYPFNEARVFMVYNADKIKDNVVKDYLDAASRPELKGKYLVPANLAGQTSNAILYSILTNYIDKNGEYSISDEGWNQLEKYFTNGTVTTEGQTPGGELVNDRVDYIYTWLSNVPILERELNIKLGVVNPPYGVPQTFEQIGIINKANIKPNAQKFIDLLGGAELMGQMAEKFGFVPVNKDAESKIDPRVREVLEQTVPQKNDFDFIGKNIENWVEKAELNYIGK